MSSALPCVIYARVSTKEQQDEGYSIPAQLRAIRAFCTEQDLTVQAEFIEADSAGRAGRLQFTAMCDYLKKHPDIPTVVAHKQDRLYRNYRDQITLQEDLRIRPRYVLGDLPATPQGEFIADITLAQSKFYLSNLSEEVRKGMDEKVAQGGWPHKAPTGYLNDKNTRSLAIDETRAPLVRHAYQRYTTGTVSLNDLSGELFEMGLVTRTGKEIGRSGLENMLKNPIYTGRIRHKGHVYPGTHEPLVSEALFALVQEQFAPRRNGTKSRKHTFALRDWLYCSECGCKVTAENQRGHVYYRCTHGKKDSDCTQRGYTREEALMAEVEDVLSRIEIDEETAEALVRDCRTLDARDAATEGERAADFAHRIEQLDERSGKLLDSYLDDVVEAEVYRAKTEDIAATRRTLEHERSSLPNAEINTSAQVAALASQAVGIRARFIDADTDEKRNVLSQLLLNIEVKDGHIASYQYKRPFQVLEKDPKGAFCSPWWAIVDLNR